MRLEAAWAAMRIAAGARLEQLCEPFDFRWRQHARLLGAAALAPLRRVPLPKGIPMLVDSAAACTVMQTALCSSQRLGVDCEGEQLSRHGDRREMGLGWRLIDPNATRGLLTGPDGAISGADALPTAALQVASALCSSPPMMAPSSSSIFSRLVHHTSSRR